jgi:hypothetical protein
MGEVIKTVISAPIANLIILFGLLFLGIAVVGKISGKIEPGTGGRIASGVIGGILLAIGLLMYGMTPKIDGKPARILEFSADPSTVTPGKHAHLCYGVTDASSARIDPEIGEVKVAEKECVSVALSQRTTYTLAAKGLDGQTVRQQVTVEIASVAKPSVAKPEAPKPEPSTPEIPKKSARVLHFVANPPTVPAGKTVNLCYGVAEASRARIDPDVGEVTPAEKECVRVTPTRRTNYVLTARGPDDHPVRQELTVEVLEPPRPTTANAILTIRPLDVSQSEMRVLVEYVYQGDRGTNDVWVIPSALKSDGTRVSFTRTARTAASVGTNRVTVPISLGQGSDTSTAVKVCLHAGREEITCKVEPFTKVWTASTVPPRPANSISDFRAGNPSSTEMEIKVRYAYNGNRGTDGIGIAAYALRSDGSNVPGTGFQPSSVSAGEGIGTATLIKTPGTGSYTSTTVKVCLAVLTRGGQKYYEPILCQTFPYTKSWR